MRVKPFFTCAGNCNGKDKTVVFSSFFHVVSSVLLIIQWMVFDSG